MLRLRFTRVLSIVYCMLHLRTVNSQELQRDAGCEPHCSGLLDAAAAAHPGRPPLIREERH
jgi:hypothetical protein